MAVLQAWIPGGAIDMKGRFIGQKNLAGIFIQRPGGKAADGGYGMQSQQNDGGGDHGQ
jgi:hypothetical protein